MIRHPRAAVRGLTALALAAVALAGCQTPPRLGVPTTVYPVQGRCDTSATVEVGASLPLSGVDRTAGRAELTGLELGLDRVNATGGVLTAHRCLELLSKDNRSDPAVDAQALVDLVNQEKVSYLVGPFLALDIPPIRAHIAALGVPAGSSSRLDVTFKPSEFANTFPIAASMTDQATVLIDAVKRQHLDHLVLVRSNSEVAAEGVSAFEAEASSAGIALAARTYVVDTPSAASSAWAELATAGPGAVVVFDSGPTLAPLLSARRHAHSTVAVLAASSSTPVLPASTTVGVGVVVPKTLVVSRRVPSSLQSFRSQVLRALHQTHLVGPITPYAQGNDSLELFASAANGVNADDAGSIRTYIENANFEGLLGTYDYTSSQHAGLAASQLTVAPLDSLSNGLFVVETPQS